ncbi:MAG TPA: hypothetical protein H9737_01365 [Candidatus Borkfalkia faecigallinarum]|uniref:Transcriptional coactivator p15 (PC4) C-terminal domain-containing protein n=1 Tax=Candidatus Borkfalkia faecigallinarum TaxID=2838509 RepID=A0A9D1VT15_9FIRM|nr:hypothetical protein [Candidatus Borkfalkia faecigallinarum]
MAELKYEIVEKLGVLGESGNGWTKELNMVSWNDREPVYDLRTWNASHERMGKGITLSQDEIMTLRDLLNGMQM